MEQTARLAVIKRDGSRVPFNRDNVMRGVQSACGKRKVPEEVKERLVDTVEEELHREFDREVESKVIGERVMLKLRGVDEVAYIRFASEHLKLSNAGELIAELHELNSRPRDVKDQQALF